MAGRHTTTGGVHSFARQEEMLAAPTAGKEAKAIPCHPLQAKAKAPLMPQPEAAAAAAEGEVAA